jgi:major vault protein
MPSDGTRHERDLILAPNEYAYILDETDNVINYVGPAKTSLANTDQPVIFNGRNKRFERCTLTRPLSCSPSRPRAGTSC